MPKTNLTAASAPAAVVDAIRQLGRNLVIARRRRRLTQRELARRAGISHITMARVEAGRPTTAIVAYWAALWAMGLDGRLASIADPETDDEGKTLELARQPRRVRKMKRRELDADF